jgi:hypothetical protein
MFASNLIFLSFNNFGNAFLFITSKEGHFTGQPFD